MIETVIFDMDGLMFDTEVLSEVCWREVFKNHNMTINEEFMREIKGVNLKTSTMLFSKYYPKLNSFTALRQEKNNLLQQYIRENGVPIKKGLVELLNFLKLNNYKTVVATSTKRDVALEYLRQANVLHYFDNYCFGDEVLEGKPNPEIFLKAAEKAKTIPSNCLVLEDSRAGCIAARKAKMNLIWIPDQVLFKTKEKRLNNLKDVIELLKKEKEVS